MEKHKCKLCYKSYDNGRALGGHMRSHMMNLPIPPSQLRNEAAESASSASSSSEDEEQQQQRQHFEDEEEEDDKAGLLLSYGLRENPRKSFRLADPEFSFTVDAASSVVLQDRESETESSKNPTRRRSKRTRKLNFPNHHHQYHYHHRRQEEDAAIKKLKCSNKLVQTTESWAVEPEPVSSVSDATTEEDVAFCLMMLSRDKWINKKEIGKHQQEEQYDEDEEDEEYEMREAAIEKSVENSYESEEIKLCKTTRNRVGGGKYKCETCNKVFKSYQALGGHRASHKKIRAAQMVSATRETEPMELENVASTSMAVVPDRKIHECPVCFRVFSSGQALGGHKRSHVMNSAAATTTTILKNLTKNAEILIDLNLPAPIEDDEPFELSAVSDAEFVNHANR